MQIQISWLLPTVCKDRVYPGSAGLGLSFVRFAGRLDWLQSFLQLLFACMFFVVVFFFLSFFITSCQKLSFPLRDIHVTYQIILSSIPLKRKEKMIGKIVWRQTTGRVSWDIFRTPEHYRFNLKYSNSQA